VVIGKDGRISANFQGAPDESVLREALAKAGIKERPHFILDSPARPAILRGAQPPAGQLPSNGWLVSRPHPSTPATGQIPGEFTHRIRACVLGNLFD
jgi:hypothetical protein